MCSAKKFFQFFNRNIIIMKLFLFVEFFDSPNNIDLFNSTEEKEFPLSSSYIAAMLGYLPYFIIDFNLGKKISDCGSILLDSGI